MLRLWNIEAGCSALVIHGAQPSQEQDRSRLPSMNWGESGRRKSSACEEEETGRDDGKSAAISQTGVKLRYREQQSCVSVNAGWSPAAPLISSRLPDWPQMLAASPQSQSEWAGTKTSSDPRWPPLRPPRLTFDSTESCEVTIDLPFFLRPRFRPGRMDLWMCVVDANTPNESAQRPLQPLSHLALLTWSARIRSRQVGPVWTA